MPSNMSKSVFLYAQSTVRLYIVYYMKFVNVTSLHLTKNHSTSLSYRRAKSRERERERAEEIDIFKEYARCIEIH